ncbi:TPA: hypothetical protein ACXE8C_005258, partial [Klebsiella variicola]
GSVGSRKPSAAGHGHSQGAACMPGGGYALSGLQTKRNFPGRGVPPYPGYRAVQTVARLSAAQAGEFPE